ncbi:MAG: choice-of-anchor J domain-containing protein [Bacteroidales bacterium]|nr:choice-of-anchor J domain-containing protein [Bacteroidales bacterium]MCF8336873.1 choice-of-anchor J domain-containing protein [Bacteroidales bacterium]
MKKLLLLLMGFSMAGLVFGQSIDENFNDGWPDGWTTIDNGDNEGTWSYSDEYGVDGTGCVELDCYDSGLPNSGQADDWLITPQFTVAEGDMMSFDTHCNADYPDEISIMISKTGTNEEDFDIVVAENVEITGEYTEYQYSITDLADVNEGDQVYVGIHCNTNGSYVDVDNFFVGPAGDGFEEDFNDGLPENWSIVDEGSNDSTWMALDSVGLEETTCAYVDCYDPGPADDWMITHQAQLSEGDYLSFWADMGYQDFHDTLIVKMSKNSNAIEDFDIIVDSIITTTEGFTKFNYPISEIEGVAPGDDVYIALHAASFGSEIYVDNMRLGSYVPPEFDKAYAVSESAMDVMYDISVTTGDINLSEIVLNANGETITFSDFTIDENNDKLVHFTGASSNMVADNEADTLTNTEVESEIAFYAGVLPLSYLSLTNPDGHLIADGPVGTFTGIVTYINESEGRVWLNDAAGAHNGVNTYQAGTSLADSVNVGDEIMVYGSMSPYENQTEIFPVTYVKTLSEDNAMFDATAINGSDISADLEPDTDPGEQYEGTLVKVDTAIANAYMEEFVLNNGDTITAYECTSNDATFYVGDYLGIYTGEMSTLMSEGSTYSIKGYVVNKGGYYMIVPRFEADIQNLVGITEIEKQNVVSVYPNPVRDRLFLETSEEIDRLVVYNIAGEQVLRKSMENRNTLNTSNLRPGVYFLRMYNKNQWIQTSRVVKQ